MRYSYVNQKTINGKVYTAYRDDNDPKMQAIECDGKVKNCRLKDVWSSDQKIEELFK